MKGQTTDEKSYLKKKCLSEESKTNTPVGNRGKIWTDTSPQNISIGKDAHTSCHEGKAKWSTVKHHSVSTRTRTARLHTESRECWGKPGARDRSAWSPVTWGWGRVGWQEGSAVSCPTKGTPTKPFSIHTAQRSWKLHACRWLWKLYF